MYRSDCVCLVTFLRPSHHRIAREPSNQPSTVSKCSGVAEEVDLDRPDLVTSKSRKMASNFLAMQCSEKGLAPDDDDDDDDDEGDDAFGRPICNFAVQ